jgi:hypothetical protein
MVCTAAEAVFTNVVNEQRFGLFHRWCGGACSETFCGYLYSAPRIATRHGREQGISSIAPGFSALFTRGETVIDKLTRSTGPHDPILDHIAVAIQPVRWPL